MKFDTVIIGGGLSGLTAGISLAEAGRKVAIVSTGQSAMHFSSGSLELLSCPGNPIEAMAKLPSEHPYSRLGADRAARYAAEVPGIFARAGIKTSGTHEANHYRLTPVGMFKPTWLTLEDYITVENPADIPWRSACVINLHGFLDFYPDFIVAGLNRAGVSTRTVAISAPAIERRRESTTEMRATNIARVLHGDTAKELARAIRNAASPDDDMILLPAVAGFRDFEASRMLKAEVGRPMAYVATMGTSVPGVRAQLMLERRFTALGGTYLPGDTVVRGHFDGTRLKAVETANFRSDLLHARDFILASGSFFSRGLVATPERVEEPVFGLDVSTPVRSPELFNKDLFSPQPFMKSGILTEGSDFKAMRDGRPIENLYVCGSALAGADALKEGSGAGIATLTALAVSEKLKNNN